MTTYDTGLNSAQRNKISQRIAILVHEGQIEDGVTESDVAEMLTQDDVLGEGRKIHHASTRAGLRAAGIQCSSSQPINTAERLNELEERIKVLEETIAQFEVEVEEE